MIRAFDANPSVRPVIDRTFPLADLADAFRYEEGATHFGKICTEM
jgi:NADPH:quinone reductase-like Zn-dependent oxidoreductase